MRKEDVVVLRNLAKKLNESGMKRVRAVKKTVLTLVQLKIKIVFL